jgi:hypothetical protein
LEAEWQRTGAIGELRVPADYRGFVFKTVVSLRTAGIVVTQQAIIDSISRWLAPSQVAELQDAFAMIEGKEESPDR